MPKLEYFIVTESVSVDQFTNKISLFEVLETIHVPKFPAAFNRMFVVSAWNAEPGDESRDFQIQIKINPPDGSEPQTFEHNVPMPAARCRNIQCLQGIPFKCAGKFTIELSLNKEHFAFHTIDVELMPISGSETPAKPAG